MNKRGFTLVEVISVIVLLGLLIGIAVPNVMKSSKKAKERTLLTKIENIEKAAVLYGQDKRNKISRQINNGETAYSLCIKKGSTDAINNCYYYSDDGTTPTTITVGFLANPDGDETTDDGYIEYDDKVYKTIKNSMDESKYLNDCKIQIYQKYGKIYAVYDKTYTDDTKDDMKCWVD